MSRSIFGKRGPESPERVNSNKASEQAEECVLGAWRALALAGAPRCPKKERAAHIATACSLFDCARGHLTSARRSFGCLTEKVKLAEERKANAAPEDRTYYTGPKAHEKAGITSLRPVVSGLAADLRRLGTCLRAFRGGATERPRYPGRSAEYDAAQRCLPFLSEPQPYRHCHWCGKVEGKWMHHYGIDGEGYVVYRENACRFCCRTCFLAGADLADPAPKPVDPSVQPVSCRVDGPPALPPHAAAPAAEEGLP